ncbi:MAG: heavy metal translocating P-type ATPase metal-binding domain-containing protein [Polaribacter sp.]
MSNSNCYHCGTTCSTDSFVLNEKQFCCNGYKTVYELLVENDMTCYYDFESNPGAIPKEIEDRYEYLSKPDIQEKLLEFSNEQTSIVNLYIPHIHCSSCICILS